MIKLTSFQPDQQEKKNSKKLKSRNELHLDPRNHYEELFANKSENLKEMQTFWIHMTYQDKVQEDRG